MPHSLMAGDFAHENDDYSSSTLTVSEQRKCRQKFEAYKP